MAMNPFPGDEQRLRELILHLSLRCADWQGFDVFLLERMLFQADFLHFRRYGFPITGQTYRRGIRSPAPRILSRLLRGLSATGGLEILELPLGDGLHVRRVPRAYREPDLRLFDGQEIAVVEQVIRHYRERWSAGSDEADLLAMPWEAAGPREEIPYALALVGALNESASWTPFRANGNLLEFPAAASPDSAVAGSLAHLISETEQAQGMRKLAHHTLLLAS
jgi:hypothetical protein